jgi:hypothetical protein
MYASEMDKVEFNDYSEEVDGFCWCWTFDSQDINIYEYTLVD